MTIITERVDPPWAGDERATTTGFLDYLRGTVHLKCAGLSEEDARRSVLPSQLMTMAGIVSHLRWVEEYWFEVVLAGRPSLAPYTKEDPDADFRIPDGVTITGLLGDYAAQCAVSRDVVAGLDLDHEVPFRGDGTVSVRWVLVHMVEETGRHAGHLDVVREFLDGVTGE
ncbi:DinB family protein [Solihabitans fulvus]|uniref:DinB family protein n=1 Tax=Solihabitans fulvus TaxID=1892852 RepID=A0A5B2X5K5_9PSEU|nr:DinB family protein [Solihabitans fulvus]KAA2258658.1 DinB family protein [Solihabitans fulvus]